jgi:hypothetical protein
MSWAERSTGISPTITNSPSRRCWAGSTASTPISPDIGEQIEARVARIPGAVDVHLHQIVDAPELFVKVDRTRASQMGLTQRDVANNMLVALSSSGQAAPNYWLNPQNGVNYQVAVSTPVGEIWIGWGTAAGIASWAAGLAGLKYWLG